MDTVAESLGQSNGWVRRVRKDLVQDAREPHAARSLVADCLRADGVDESCIDLAVLGTSELVTNALLHGAPPCKLRLFTGGGRFRVEVLDASTARPLAQVPTSSGEGGRGLAMIAALSHRWGCEVTATEKSVWFEGFAHPG